MRVALLFPPGWSLTVGNPHIALPLLRSTLEQYGVSVSTADLNLGSAEYYGVRMDKEDVEHALLVGSMESMNDVYFSAEDTLMEASKAYGGSWNVQLGFTFDDLSHYSSKDVKEAMTLDSPFTSYFKKKVLPWISRQDSDVVGLSIASIYQLIPALHLSWLLRRNGYERLIVFGGNTVSRLTEELVKDAWLFDLVDGFICFQGEMPFVTLVQAYRSKSDFGNVPNLIWKDKAGVIRKNPILQDQHPNAIPTPNFTDLPVGEYWGTNYLPLLSARGCYYGKCNFCAIPYGYGENGFSGIRDSSNVLKDIVTLGNRYGLQRYKFMDEALPPKILFSLSQRIIEEGVDIEWEAYLRLENCWLDRAFVKQASRSGFKKGYFGLEIYPEESRTELRKHDNAEAILTILNNCNDAGIKVHLFCMFGYPGTGRREAEKTIEFILKHSNLIDTVDLNAYTYARHTRILGIEKKVNPHQDWALEYEYVPTTEGNLSSKEVEELATEMEEIVWTECPRMLHPTYRLVSPWDPSSITVRKDIDYPILLEL